MLYYGSTVTNKEQHNEHYELNCTPNPHCTALYAAYRASKDPELAHSVPTINGIAKARQQISALFVALSIPTISGATDVSEFSSDGSDWMDRLDAVMPEGSHFESEILAINGLTIEKMMDALRLATHASKDPIDSVHKALITSAHFLTQKQGATK